ncbi:hypothetical protein BOX15_Mlig012143g2 [Macrostomum lignano]|uniref:Uncharacterized protein n=2 Tax=Macrostomum lignano TaxID=282301 RepID=A0A267H1U5_9PLAT|nr:hypothetical protein BOX15_Mlig012143g2 [Macrostomum lignano]
MGLIKKAIVGAVISIAVYQVLHHVLYDAYAMWRYAPNRENTSGKRVLITGSSKGVGRALAQLYCELGAHVIVHSRSLKSLEEVQAECRKLGAASVYAVTGDMSVVGQADEVVNWAAKAMGGLDIVIVNHVSTYVFETLHSVVSRLRSGELQKSMQVDLFSYAETALAAIPILERTSGSLVLVSSVAGRMPVPYFFQYASAKASLEGFSKSLRQELAINGSNVHCGVAILGAIDTQSAHDLLPKVFSGPIEYAPVRQTAVSIATVAAGRINQLVTPPALKAALLLASLMPEKTEEQIWQGAKRL